MPEPEKLESVPPETERSLATKLVDPSEREKERVAVSPAFREATSELTAMVGAVRSVSWKTRTCPALFSLSSLNREPMATVLPSRDREIWPPL